MTQDAVKAFLYQTLGYGKIEEILRGGKLSTAEIRGLLEGTLFGTSKSKHASGQELPPRIPRIYALEGFTKTQNRDGGIEIILPNGSFIYLSKDCAGLGLS